MDARILETENEQLKLDKGYELQKRVSASSEGFAHQIIQAVLWVLAAGFVLLLFVLIRKSASNRMLALEIVKKERDIKNITLKVSSFKKQVEETVYKQTLDLQEKLEEERQREADLRKRLKQVEEADYLKNAFLGSLSHEIRTPLSGIVGFSNLLQTELAVMGNAELYEYTTNIEESSNHLTGLLDNIIDISSIEANMLEVELQFDHFNNIVKDVKEIYEKKAKDKGLVFKVKIDLDLPKLKADSMKLKKVLNILTDNAVKFSQSGFVTITTDYNPDKNLAVIQVKDTGPGIDPETLKSLLASFQYGTQNKTQIYQGKGIGLTLAHRFVSMMGGKISINSQSEKGTTVTIAIPCVGEKGEASDVDTPVENVSLATAPELGEISLFILEDDRMNRLVLEKMLKKAGKITMAVDGDDAILKIENAFNRGEIFRVMLFDMQLPPPWDGVSVMKTVKDRMPAYRSVPFIIQTAFAMSGDRDSYIDAGFDDYISKPINKTELLTMIQKHLHLRES
jgi:signal transduction histidine kinase/ActR/RegA family two-component response regulator